MDKQAVGVLVFILKVTFLVVAFGGWVMNVFKVVATIDNPLTWLFVFRGIGMLLMPLGAVLGFV